MTVLLSILIALALAFVAEVLLMALVTWVIIPVVSVIGALIIGSYTEGPKHGRDPWL